MNSELLIIETFEDLKYDPFLSSNMLLNQNLDEKFFWIGFKSKMHYTEASVQRFS